MSKIITANQVESILNSGDTIMVGGFGLVGAPLHLLETIANSTLKDLTVISNNLGEAGKGLGVLVLNNQVKKGIGSYFTSNPDVVDAYLKGKIEIELLPQGTLSEAIRAGGAGIGGFFTSVSTGTKLADKKEKRIINGKEYVLQKPLHADVSLVKAKKADSLGNLIYNKSSRNFNPAMATAGKVTIAEVNEIVEVGDLNPEEIITPHLYVDYIVNNKGDG